MFWGLVGFRVVFVYVCFYRFRCCLWQESTLVSSLGEMRAEAESFHGEARGKRFRV